jgi:hypothetical protein
VDSRIGPVESQADESAKIWKKASWIGILPSLMYLKVMNNTTRKYQSRRKAILIGADQTCVSYRAIAGRMKMLAMMLTRAEMIVYLGLLERLGSKDVCWPSEKQIVADTSLSRRAVQKATRNLQDRGLLTKMKGRRSVTYELHEAEEALGLVQEGGAQECASEGARECARNGRSEEEHPALGFGCSPSIHPESKAGNDASPAVLASLAVSTPKGCERAEKNGHHSLADLRSGQRIDAIKQVTSHILDAWQAANLHSDAGSYDDLLGGIEAFCDEMEIASEELDLLWRMRVQPRVCTRLDGSADGQEFFLHRHTRKKIGPGWLFRHNSKGCFNIISVDNGAYGGPEPPRFFPGQKVRCIDPCYAGRAGKVGTVEKARGRTYHVRFDSDQVNQTGQTHQTVLSERQLEEA